MTTAEILKSSNFIITLAVLIGALATIGLLVWKDKRPRKDLTPSLVPTVPVLLFAGIVALLALVHMVNSFGIHTGR